MVVTAAVVASGGGSLREPARQEAGSGSGRSAGHHPAVLITGHPPGLCPQAGGAVLCSTHQLPLGVLSMLGLQQGRVRPLLQYSLLRTPVPQELQRDPEQGPPPAIAPPPPASPETPTARTFCHLRVKDVAQLESVEGALVRRRKGGARGVRVDTARSATTSKPRDAGPLARSGSEAWFLVPAGQTLNCPCLSPKDGQGVSAVCSGLSF